MSRRRARQRRSARRKPAHAPSLEKAARRAADALFRPPALLPIPAVLFKPPRQQRPARTSAPRQRELFTRNVVRPSTVGLGSLPLTRQARRKLDAGKAWHLDLCAQYHRERKARRSTLFAKGTAGSGRKVLGRRTRDWRAEICK